MKIKTRKTNSYPGDKTIQIIAIDEHKRTIPLMNINRFYCKGYYFYENDTNGIDFESIKEVKQWCKDNIDKLLPNLEIK